MLLSKEAVPGLGVKDGILDGLGLSTPAELDIHADKVGEEVTSTLLLTILKRLKNKTKPIIDITTPTIPTPKLDLKKYFIVLKLIIIPSQSQLYHNRHFYSMRA